MNNSTGHHIHQADYYPTISCKKKIWGRNSSTIHSLGSGGFPETWSSYEPSYRSSEIISVVLYFQQNVSLRSGGYPLGKFDFSLYKYICTQCHAFYRNFSDIKTCTLYVGCAWIMWSLMILHRLPATYVSFETTNFIFYLPDTGSRLAQAPKRGSVSTNVYHVVCAAALPILGPYWHKPASWLYFSPFTLSDNNESGEMKDFLDIRSQRVRDSSLYYRGMDTDLSYLLCTLSPALCGTTTTRLIDSARI